jgi:hypothetical protein
MKVTCKKHTNLIRKLETNFIDFAGLKLSDLNLEIEEARYS